MKWYSMLALIAVTSALVAACSDSSSSSGGGGIAGRTLRAVGGEGTNGAGGNSGRVWVYAYTGGDCKVSKSGSVNTSVTVPNRVPYLGTNPLTVTADVSVQPLPLGSTTATVLGDDGVNPATGIWVQRGVTVTLLPNYDENGTPATGTFERCYLAVANGIYVEGTVLMGRQDLTVQDDNASLNGTHLDLNNCNNVVIASTGRIDSSGSDNVAGAGGNGGWIEADIDGTVVNRGTIITAGGDGTTSGGNAGYINLYSNSYGIYNTGTINSSGGNASAGTGGDADYCYWDADYGMSYNSGTMLAVGGNGTTGGGNGGYLELYTSSVGSCVNAGGTMNSSGGNATVSGNGGNADEIYVYAYGGTFRVTGDLIARGGDAPASGTGGDGGYIEIANDYTSQFYDEYVIGGGAVGANIDASGGDGGTGGNADDVYIDADEDEYVHPTRDTLYVVGYSEINTSGGDGTTDGGNGDYIELYVSYGYDENQYWMGNLYNDVPLIARGGNGGTGTGGDGGSWICIYDSDDDYPRLTPNGTVDYDRIVKNTAVIDVVGGNGATGGGLGGYVWMYGYRQLENSGACYCSGGNTTSGSGGNGGQIEIASDDVLKNSGALIADGGDSTLGTGGDGDEIDLYGRTIQTSATISCDGGDGATTGGNGGYVEIFGGLEQTSTVSGSVTADAGTGVTDGTDGDVWIDGIHVSGP